MRAPCWYWAVSTTQVQRTHRFPENPENSRDSLVRMPGRCVPGEARHALWPQGQFLGRFVAIEQIHIGIIRCLQIYRWIQYQPLPMIMIPPLPSGLVYVTYDICSDCYHAYIYIELESASHMHTYACPCRGSLLNSAQRGVLQMDVTSRGFHYQSSVQD